MPRGFFADEVEGEDSTVNISRNILLGLVVLVSLASTGLAQNRRAALGVTLDPQVHDAAVVTSVVAGGPAARAGVRPGDKIVGVNDRQVRNFGELIWLVGNMPVNSQVLIKIHRNGQTVSSWTNLAAQAAVFGAADASATPTPAATPAPASVPSEAPAQAGGGSRGYADD